MDHLPRSPCHRHHYHDHHHHHHHCHHYHDHHHHCHHYHDPQHHYRRHHHHHHHPYHCHHHHHDQHHHQCALHSRPNSCPSFASPSARNLQPRASVTEVNPTQEHSDSSSTVLQELEHANSVKAEDDEEPVFVLTDEWMEFFAKSEAKRKSEKKQAKKECKN